MNYDFERTFQELRNTVYRLETEPRWVPMSWLSTTEQQYTAPATQLNGGANNGFLHSH